MTGKYMYLKKDVAIRLRWIFADVHQVVDRRGEKGERGKTPILLAVGATSFARPPSPNNFIEVCVCGATSFVPLPLGHNISGLNLLI